MQHSVRQLFATLATLTTLIPVTGCGSKATAPTHQASQESDYVYNPLKPDYTFPEGTTSADFEFRKGGLSVVGLTSKVHKTSIKVCYSDPYNQDSRKDIVRKSILKWVGALKSVASKPLSSQVEIAAWGASGCDVYFNIGEYSPANTNMGSVPQLNIAPSGWYGSETVILHEFGHAFGLLDTYNGTGGSCQTDQPASVMCYAKYSELMQDDILGIRSVYKDLHPN